MHWLFYCRDQFLFGEADPLIELGRQRVLEASDFPTPHRRFSPESARDLFQHLPLDKGGWGFLWHIVKELRRPISFFLVLATLTNALNLMAPILVRALIGYVATLASGDGELWKGIALALTLCFVSVSFAVSMQHYFYNVLGVMQMIVNGLSMRLYEKSLRLSRASRMKRPTGDVVNLMGSDMDYIAEVIFSGTDLFFGAVTIASVSAMLFLFLGSAAWAGLAVLAVVVPVTRFLVKRFSALDGEILKRRDERVSLITQVFTGIRIVKFFAWEKLLRHDVEGLRSKEVALRQRIAVTGGLSMVVYFMGSTMVGVAAFGTHLYLGRTLDAATVFSCLTLFGMLENPFGNLTEWILNVSGAKVSAERVAEYLRSPEIPQRAESLTPAGEALAVSMVGLTARYADASQVTLTNISCHIPRGSSVAVIGPVGSGKTSLLYTLLEEIPLESGEITIGKPDSKLSPRIAFVPQESFVLNDSLEANIRMGLPGTDEDSDRLWDSLHAAAMAEDVQRLPAGIRTEIGEHGVNLSGGQKQRLSLARADYSEAGLILLDDPLSAVDFATEDYLVEHLVFGRWKNATRIVVTHRLHHLGRFDKVMFMRDGTLFAEGHYQELLHDCPEFRSFIADTLQEARETTHVSVTKTPDKPAAQDVESRITEDEDREQGKVAKTLYVDYMKLLGGDTSRQRRVLLPLLGFSTVLVTMLPIVQNAWLSAWTNRTAAASTAAASTSSTTQFMSQWLGSDWHNLRVYAFLGLAVLFAILGRYLLWMFRAIAAGKSLHDRAFKAVVELPLRFFDATPVGRILNRFSRDMDSVDRELAWAFEQTFRSAMNTIGSVLVLVALFPWLAIVIVPLALVFRSVQAAYRSVSREAQRLCSIARSPRFSHFKETIAGSIVIRAYGRQAVFEDKNRHVLAEYQRMFHGLVLFNRWFSIRIPLISGVLSAAVMIGIMVSARHGLILAGTAGLAVMYAMRFWESLNWSIRSFSQVEAKMTSVERLQHFAGLEAETLVVGPHPLADNVRWPATGSISFEQVSARYAPHLPMILKDVSFRIPSGARVGVIGRTGAGKSTVFQVLYRFLNPAKGRVLIDGIDTANIPLPRLRSSLAIIPQDPTLFKGTLRSNLDRFVQHTDASLWRALQRAHLDTFVQGLPGGLDADVKENGHNFSQGQRQLFCLARALLQDATIIVMDEATANVDVETDALIQAAIREECAGRTVLIIAHRLETVLDCDMLLEFADGRLVRQGPPPQRAHGIVDYVAIAEPAPALDRLTLTRAAREEIPG